METIPSFGNFIDITVETPVVEAAAEDHRGV
jgi:hypothetical protein